MEPSMEVSAHQGPFNPLAPLGRSWRRLRRRPRAMQVRTAVIVIAIVVGLVAWLVLAPSGTPGGAGSAGAAEVASAAAPAGTPVNQASTSTRGVSATEINVVFPVVAVNSEAGRFGFAQDKEYNEQTAAINLYVDQINKDGGVNGRKINPMIVSFDPREQREHAGAVPAVDPGQPAGVRGDRRHRDVDGRRPAVPDRAGTHPSHQRLVHHHELDADGLALPVVDGAGPGARPGRHRAVGSELGAPGPRQEGRGRRLGPGRRPGGTQLLSVARPQAGGDHAQVSTVAGNPDQSATTSSEAQLAVERFKAAGVQSVFPLLPENAFFPYLAAENSQQYFPQLLLSDYQSTIEVALGLIPVPYETALNGQEGVTTETLGGFDDARPESQGGYDPGVRSCYETWHAYHPKPIAGTTSFYIEEQGPIQAWCGAIRLFATAAKDAGKDLNRRTFVEAMSKITNYPGTLSPVWSFGPNKFYGPTQYQVVKIHNNVPPSSQCKLKTNHQPQGTCWVTEQPFKPLPSS